MSKHKLLLADDSITIQKVVNLTFAEQGIDVITVGDGDAALEKMAEIRPDIVLADVNMPGLNGYQICESIRKDEATKDVPVILLVGSFEPFNVDEADRVGANAFLTKPFNSIRELIEQVSELLEPIAADGAVSQTEMTETDDIVSLYKQSFDETVETPQDEKIDFEFADAGMDDEIIETTYADSSQESRSGTASPDRRETVGDSVNFETSDGAGDTVEEKYNDQPGDNIDAGLHLPPIENIKTDNGFESTVLDQIEESTIAEELPDTLGFDKVPNKTSYQFDELDLLELPATDGKTFEFTTAEKAVDAGSKTQIVSLSPELIETIVQKVVEKLVEKR